MLHLDDPLLEEKQKEREKLKKELDEINKEIAATNEIRNSEKDRVKKLIENFIF